MLKRREVLFSFVYPLVSGWQGTEPNNPLSVCEVLKRVELLRGQIVKVKGKVLLSRHGMVMVDPHPYPCRSSFPESKQKWDLTLDISASNDSLTRREGIPNSGVEGYTRLLRAVEASGGTRMATVTGELRFKPDFRVTERDSGIVGGTGYGQMGWCPAQIVVKTFLE